MDSFQKQKPMLLIHPCCKLNLKDYKDEYRKRVMEFVEKKAKGHKPEEFMDTSFMAELEKTGFIK